MENNTEASQNNGETLSGFQQDLVRLRQAPLLRGLDGECLNLLALLCERVAYSPNDELMAQGEDDGQAYLLLSGTADCLYSQKDKTMLIRQINPGDFIGGCALLARMESVFTVKATTAVTALKLSRKQFNKAMEQHPADLKRIIRNLTGELANWDHALMENIDQSTPGRTGLGVSLL